MILPAFFDSRKTLQLFGQKNNFNFFKDLLTKNKFPSVTMLSGKKGIGKLTLINHLMFFYFHQHFGFRHLRSNLTSKVHIWTLQATFSVEKSIYGTYKPHTSGRKSISGPHRPHISGRKSIYGLYGPNISGRKSGYGSHGPHISGGRSTYELRK